MALEDAQGQTMFAAPVIQQHTLPTTSAQQRPQPANPIDALNPMGSSQSTVNAAGTAENLALHVALLVAFAMIGVYVFRASGFKFVVAGSVGR
jgi:hypothetical protein